MKSYFFKVVCSGMMLSAVLFSAGCQKEEILAVSEVVNLGDSTSARLGMPKKFDHVQFAMLIEQHMESKVAGFGYSIFHNGEEYYRTDGGAGWARKKFETPFQSHGAVIQQEIINTTQYVTAVAMIRTLEKHGIPLTGKVYPYLPKDWKPSDLFKELSFERLLAHKTGLINYHTLSTLRKTVEGPMQESEFKDEIRDDDDINYRLLAIILPYVEAKELAKKGNTTMLNQINSKNSEAELFPVLSSHFRGFVYANVFIPAGLSKPHLIGWRAWDDKGDIDAAQGTMGYPSKNGDEPGIPKADNTLNGGATGLYISASQFAKIQSAVSQFKIISLNGLETMKAELLGFDDKIGGDKGYYYWKKGVGMNCETMIFDFGRTQVAVFANSMQSEISSPQVLADLYDKCWIPL